MKLGGKEGCSVMLATSLAFSAGVGETNHAVAGGEYSGPYCQTAVESFEPFSEARQYWGMKSFEDSDGSIKILLCEDEARIDVPLGLEGYIELIHGNPGSAEIKQGEILLESAGCHVEEEGTKDMSDVGVVSQHVTIDYSQACAANTIFSTH